MKSTMQEMIKISLLVCFLAGPWQGASQPDLPQFPAVLSVRDQAENVFKITQMRLDQLIPEIMLREGFDMWIVACNEDNPDPIYQTMIPYKMWTPITQIIVFYLRGPGDVERLNISRTILDGLFTNAWDFRSWDQNQGEGQWECLKRIVHERNPQKIGINIGEIQWAAGGLTVALHKEIKNAVGRKYASRLSSAEPMATLWGMLLLEEEIGLMERSVGISRAIISEMFSTRAITPNKTTIEDLHYYYWKRVTDLGLDIAFPPQIRIRGRRNEVRERYGENDRVIRPGDFVYCDVGLKYMRYHTDNAEWAYVPMIGAEDVPDEFKYLMKEGNRLQDIFCQEFEAGLTGNEILGNVLKEARSQGIPGPRIYSHSIGYFLHETGPLIGLPWEQDNIPGRGDVRLEEISCFTAELSVSIPIEELDGQVFTMPLEQIIVFSDKGALFLGGRQTEFHLVK